MEPIRSLANARVKHLVRLRNRRERDRTGTFLIEGYRELSKAAGKVEIQELYYSPDLYLGENEETLVDRVLAGGATAIELGEAAFRKVAYRDRPEGLLAVARQFDTSLSAIDPPGDALLLVVEAIEKPGNLGTMLRTADAAGAHAVMVCDPTTDPFNPNAVRASIGSLFTVPLAVVGTEAASSWLADRNIQRVAATPHAERLYWQIDYSAATALVIGSEQVGLSRRWLDDADALVRVPMAGSADSLNAAMAAGVLLFEAVRQRHCG